MSDLTTTIQRVLDLDKQATPGPWTPQMMEGIDGDTLSAAGPEHAITDDENDDERDNSSDAALADARLIAEYRTAAPVLARAVTALEAQLAAAEARADHAEEGERIVKAHVADLMQERDALRADLVAARAERDGLDEERQRVVMLANRLDADLASARQEAEGLRARLTALDKHTFDQDDDNAPLYVLRDEMLAALSSPAPVPATPVSAIHNVGKPCPVCSGCDVCLGTGRAPHYVPAPVPATPAPDALALLREARHALDSAWSLRPSVDVELVPTAFRPLSVRTLFAKIDAALTGRA